MARTSAGQAFALAVAALLCALLAGGCGRLADASHRGPPLAVMAGTVTHEVDPVVAGDLAIALEWLPASELARLLGTGAVPAPACPDLASPELACDGSPAQGGATCHWRADRVAELLQVVEHDTTMLGRVEIRLADLPPRAALFDLARQGGAGTIALAAVVAFDDRDRDGVFRPGGPGSPPEPALASSLRPARGQPRLAFLVAFLDGALELARIQPALAEPLRPLPQGFSLLIEEAWLDGAGRREDGTRYWSPIGTPIVLDLAPGAGAGCLEEEREALYLSSIPGDPAPLWCSDDGLRVTWSRTTSPEPCHVLEERFAADYRCAAAPPPTWACPVRTTGSLRVAVATFGEALDPDGYAVRVAGRAARRIPPSGSIVLPALAPGSQEVALDGVATNCAVMGRNPSPALITVGQPTGLEFTVACGETRQGAIRVRVATTGAHPDPDGYTVSVDGSLAGVVGPAGIATLPELEPGLRLVSIAGLATNCAVKGTNPLQVALAPGATAEAEFEVACVPRVGRVRVSTATTGVDLDADGFLAGVSGSDCFSSPCDVVEQATPIEGSVVFDGVREGAAFVVVRGLAWNCRDLDGDQPHPITIAHAQTTEVALRFHCAPIEDLAAMTLAYVSTAGGYAEINLARPSGETQRITAGSWDTDPAWSPDGTRILFTRSGWEVALWVVNVDGSGLQQLTTGGFEFHPAWSPDGTRIAFVDWAGIHVMDADGTNVTRLTDGGADWYPSWSPDGTRLAFARHEAAFWNPGRIWVVRADGSEAAPLTSDVAAADTQPRWSPDGTRIAFARARCDDGTCHDVFVMNADGSGATLLASSGDAAGSYLPAWSPDGQWIAFTSGNCVFFGSSCVSHVRVIRADGTAPTVVAPFGASQPAWRP